MAVSTEVAPGLTDPSDELTFLFTDVEGSVRLWAADPGGTARSFEFHDALIREVIEANHGYVFGTAGDSFRGVFETVDNALAAAAACQAGLANRDWADGPELRVRMGLHRGQAHARAGDYFGHIPNTAARVEALGHGGQILMTGEVAELASADTLWLGNHRVRDVPEVLSIYQYGQESHRPLRVVDPDFSTLPNPGSPIIGRSQQIFEARQLLETAQLITLTGVGGCGKTRLAVEIAYREMPSRPDGCYFADLSAVSDGSELPAALATSIRLTLAGGDPIDQIINHLATKTALLILDNCEHLLDDCADFAERLLARAGDTALLATTRERLAVDGEHVFGVPSLIDDAGPDSAIELFVARATAASPGASFNEADRSTIEEICARLDGMPLAIELAAARVSILSPSELLARMEDRFRLLSGGRGRNRRRTLQATLDWSFDLLDADEQQMFRRCGVFVGPFDLAAAIAVGGYTDYESMDLLDSLVAKSLIATEDLNGLTQFRLLETVRIYAGDQLAQAAEVAEARDTHLDHYQQRLHAPTWVEANDLDRAPELLPLWANVSSALEWATANDRWKCAGRLAYGSQSLWEHEVPAQEGRRWIDLIAGKLDDADHELQHELRSNLSRLCLQIDAFEHAGSHLRELCESPHLQVQAESIAFYAFLIARRHPDDSEASLDRVDQLIAANELDLPSRIVAAWARGALAMYRNQLDEADQWSGVAYELAASHRRTTTYLVISSVSYAISRILTGHPQDALDLLDRHRLSLSVWDCSEIIRAVALIELRRASDARDLVRSYSSRALRGRLSRMANDALIGMAALALDEGDVDQAWQLLCTAATPRTPATIALAEGLADRIGRGDELRHTHRTRSVPLISLDASEALRTRLDAF